MQHSLSWFEGKNVVITGVAGFIGSHLAQKCLEAGASVYGIDNFLTGSHTNIEHLATFAQWHFIKADCIQQPSYLPSDVVVDAVLHFASPASPPRYQAHPVATYQVNTWATHNLLEYLRDNHPQARFLFASTSEVYGDPAVHPQPETYWGNVNPNGTRSCYDEAKRMGETICGVFHREYRMDTRIVRIFNTYGPNMDVADGRIIPNFVSQTLKNQPLTVYGQGMQTRSYCHVDDLVNGIVTYLALPNLAGETINLGNPEEFTALETATLIWQRVHPDSKPIITFRPLPSDDPTQRRPDISKAKKVLQWTPTIPFAEGIQTVITSFKNRVVAE